MNEPVENTIRPASLDWRRYIV